MADFGMYLATVFGGVLGSLIGFGVIVLVALLLALPYLAFMSEEGRDNRSSGRNDDRYRDNLVDNRH